MSVNGPIGNDGQPKPLWDLVTENAYKFNIPGVTDNNGNVPVVKNKDNNGKKGVEVETANWQNIPPKKEPTDRKGETKITYGNKQVAYVRDFNNGYSRPFWHGKAEAEKDKHIIITKGEKVYIPGHMADESQENVLKLLHDRGLACSEDGLEVRKGSNNRGFLLTSCAVKDEPAIAKTGTVVYVDPVEVIPAVLTEDDQRIFDDAMNAAIDKEVKTLNEANPKTKDGIGYKYNVNSNYTEGNITLDGTKIVLPFDIAKDGDAKKQTDGGLLLTANIHGNPKDNVITSENLAEYINILGGNVKPEDVKFTYSKNDSGQAQITYENGFIHVVNDSAEVKAESPVGQLQKAFGRLQLNAGGDLVTKMKSGPAAEGNIGLSYELKAGDLNKITTGNPEVKFSLGDIAIEGKVSAKNGVVTITGQGGKTVTIKPEHLEDIVSDDGADGLTITSSDGKKYEIAYDPELTNPQTDVKDGNYCTIREIKNGRTGTETFFKVDGDTFDASTPSKRYDTLNDAYEVAVEKFKAEAEYYIAPEVIVNTFMAEAEANVSITWKWPWQ